MKGDHKVLRTTRQTFNLGKSTLLFSEEMWKEHGVPLDTGRPMWPPQGDQYPQGWLPGANASNKVIEPSIQKAMQNPESEVMRQGKFSTQQDCYGDKELKAISHLSNFGGTAPE